MRKIIKFQQILNSEPIELIKLIVSNITKNGEFFLFFLWKRSNLFQNFGLKTIIYDSIDHQKIIMVELVLTLFISPDKSRDRSLHAATSFSLSRQLKAILWAKCKHRGNRPTDSKHENWSSGPPDRATHVVNWCHLIVYVFLFLSFFFW